MSHTVDLPALSEPLHLGSDSLLWRWADQRLAFTGLTAGLLQLMHPAIGAGVVEHSDFFSDPWDRVFRSVPQILEVVYGGPTAERAGRKVRNYHRRITGVDYLGRPYDALSPETFWYAHATFQHSVQQVAERFSYREFTAAQRDRLYREGVEWHRRYDVGMTEVPPDFAAWHTKWSHYNTSVLEMTPAAQQVLDMSLHGRAEHLPGLPSWTLPIQRQLLTPVFRLTQIGGLPKIVRDRFDIPWTVQNQLELQAFEEFVRRTWRFLPARLRIPPEGLAGRRREAAAGGAAA